MTRFAQVVAGLLAASYVGTAPVPSRQACPMIGAVYTAKAGYRPDDTLYRMTPELLPDDADGSAIFTMWRIRRVAPGGRVLSELRLHYECGMGRAPCVVHPRHPADGDDSYSSETIFLDRDFAPTRGDGTPHAIVTPGFGRQDWAFLGDRAAGDVTYFTKDRVAPDLEDRPVWLLDRCGPG